MSTERYPLDALIAQMRVTHAARTVADEFEDGSVDSRRYWGDKNFKRKFQFTHCPLTAQEMDLLQRFHDQRGGRYDTFFFRDNINRRGHALVRFGRDLEVPRRTSVYEPEIFLEEVAPIRALPAVEDVVAATTFTPVFWYDANRERNLTLLGQLATDAAASDTIAWDVREAYPLSAGAWLLSDINSWATQYQAYHFNGTNYGRSASNVAEISSATPVCTLFAIVKAPVISARQVLFGIGPKSSGAALGLEIDAGNYIQPYLGGSETWATARSSNGAGSIWRSVAVTWASASTTAKLYVDGALIGSEANTRSLTAGKVTFGAAQDNSLICASGTQQNHVLAFAGELTLAQIKALHNLFAYQTGMATV